MLEIFVFGDGGHAKVVIDCIEQEGKYQIKAIIKDSAESEKKFLGYDLIDIKNLSKLDTSEGIIAIGDNYTRELISKRLLEINKNTKFVSTVHPQAIISKSSTLGAGTVAFAGAIINPNCHIGNHCIINTSASIDHDSTMDDFSCLSPGVHTGGNVTIGKYSFISIGASIIHGITIGENSVIGAGASVIYNIDSSVVAVGVPAKIIKTRDKYL